jgi:hypothetical protein
LLCNLVWLAPGEVLVTIYNPWDRPSDMGEYRV